jgi:hypothetical protein
LIDNNVVNLLAAIIGAVISASFIIYYWILMMKIIP